MKDEPKIFEDRMTEWRPHYDNLKKIGNMKLHEGLREMLKIVQFLMETHPQNYIGEKNHITPSKKDKEND